MQKCKCGWCRACHARYKLAQATEPIREMYRAASKKYRPKGRKVRLDEFFQARKDFFYYLDSVEDDKAHPASSRFFLDWDKQSLIHYRNRYLTLLAACQKDKII